MTIMIARMTAMILTGSFSMVCQLNYLVVDLYLPRSIDSVLFPGNIYNEGFAGKVENCYIIMGDPCFKEHPPEPCMKTIRLPFTRNKRVQMEIAA